MKSTLMLSALVALVSMTSTVAMAAAVKGSKCAPVTEVRCLAKSSDPNGRYQSISTEVFIEGDNVVVKSTGEHGDDQAPNDPLGLPEKVKITGVSLSDCNGITVPVAGGSLNVRITNENLGENSGSLRSSSINVNGLKCGISRN